MSSAVAFTLDDLATQEGDSFELSTKKELLEAGIAYQVHIKSVECKQTKNGYLQAELGLEFTKNGNPAGRQWVMLPVFTKNLADTLGPETLHKKKQTFGKGFNALLRAADPAKFSAYSRIDKSNRSWKFYDAEDNLLSTSEKKQREQAVARATVAAAAEVAQGNLDNVPLVGSDVWLVITETPSRNPQRPEPSRWQNWFSEQPEKFPAAELKDDGVPF